MKLVVSNSKDEPGVAFGGPGDFDDGVVVLNGGGFHPASKKRGRKAKQRVN